MFDFDENGDMDLLTRTFNLNSPAYGHYKFESETPLKTFVSMGPKNYSFTTVGKVGEDGELKQEKVVDSVSLETFWRKDVRMDLNSLSWPSGTPVRGEPNQRLRRDFGSAKTVSKSSAYYYSNTNSSDRPYIYATAAAGEVKKLEKLEEPLTPAEERQQRQAGPPLELEQQQQEQPQQQQQEQRQGLKRKAEFPDEPPKKAGLCLSLHRSGGGGC